MRNFENRILMVFRELWTRVQWFVCVGSGRNTTDSKTEGFMCIFEFPCFIFSEVSIISSTFQHFSHKSSFISKSYLWILYFIADSDSRDNSTGHIFLEHQQKMIFDFRKLIFKIFKNLKNFQNFSSWDFQNDFYQLRINIFWRDFFKVL